jgi:hypothetical protein
MSIRANVRARKCPFAQVSFAQTAFRANVCRANVLRANGFAQVSCIPDPNRIQYYVPPGMGMGIEPGTSESEIGGAYH